MPSSSRNSRKPIQALRTAAAVSLLLGSAAQADDQRHNFVLTAYSNGMGGAALLSGDYETAIRQLGDHANGLEVESGIAANNRCVALAITKQWETARLACDKAVRDAELERISLSAFNIWERRTENDNVAVALSNRAVLHWMATDQTAAEKDLKRAEMLSPKAEFVARNRAALQSKHGALAMVTGAVSPAHQ